MKKGNLILLMVMCFMSVSLFASPMNGEDDLKVVKVFTSAEIIDANLFSAEFSEITSMKIVKKNDQFLLEVAGLDLNGESSVVLKADGFEILPCGSCTLPSHPRWPVEGQKILFSNGSTGCIECEEESALGPE